jgi:hypothetical protein
LIYTNNNFGNDRSKLVMFNMREGTAKCRNWFCLLKMFLYSVNSVVGNLK